MARADLDYHFSKIDELVLQINKNVPPDDAFASVQFRSDLAGLLVVAMAATYETCVKEVLCSYAGGKHGSFGDFASRNYEKLNSRIKVQQLCEYCALFDPEIKKKFNNKLKESKAKILIRTGTNIETSYGQILAWRHDFAHAWNRNTTIEEAAMTHRAAKRVLYAFDRAFY